MRPLEIFDAEIQWNKSKDRRPWLLVEKIANGCWNCFPISGKNYGGKAFQIDSGDPDFKATGLTKACYIHDDNFYQIPPASFGKRRGMLGGALLASFLRASGLKL